MSKTMLFPAVIGLSMTASFTHAQCAPTSVPAGGSIACTGLQTDEVDDGSDAITITLDNTARIVVGSGRGIDFGGNDTTIIIGADGSSTAEVVSGDSDGIRVEGSGATITNFGRIEGDDEGIQADDDGGHTLHNYGEIVAGDKGVTLGDGSSLTNYSGATIYAPEDEGVEAGDGFTLVNEYGAAILAKDDAVQFGNAGTLDNYGLIENVGPAGPAPDFPQDAIDIDSGIITNHATGVVKSTYDAAIDFDADDGSGGVVTNFGLITGTKGIEVELGNGADPANESSQLVNNFGTLIGTDGYATILGAGEDAFVWMPGSTVEGTIDLGADDDLFSVFAPTSFAELIFVDGGLGNDTVNLSGADLSNIASAALVGDTLSLALSGSGWDMSFAFTSFESFFFGGTEYTASEIVANAPAPVPLPAAGWLLITGLGLLVLRRRSA